MKFSLLFLLFILQGYSQETNFYDEDTEVNLYAFIGEKISIEEFDPNLNNKKTKIEVDEKTGDTTYSVTTSYSSDRAFIAKYKVITPVFNNLKRDTISFVVYDHYGTPEFANYNKVLLYISKYDKEGKSGYYHQKYQFDPVFVSSEGIWTAIFIFRNVVSHETAANIKSFSIKTRLFDEDVSNYNQQYIDIAFPKKFYRIKKNIATPILGTTIENVFVEKKERVFKPNGIFK